MLFIVTFLSATVLATPDKKAVKPALAPLDKSNPTTGLFTDTEVILTILPNPLFAIPSITALTNSIGVIIFISTPSIIAFLST